MTGLFDPDAPIYEWRGLNSRGQASTGRGRIGRTVALWIERKFMLGWPKLEVRRVSDSTLVGAITTRDDGQRIWWAESLVPVDRLGRPIPPTGMESPDGDDAAAHQRMVDSWAGATS